MNINGIAHIRLNVNKFEECCSFYRKLFELFEMKVIFESSDTIYAVGARTGLCIAKVTDEYKTDRFNQNRVGLHHFCFRARSREDVDTVYSFLRNTGVKIVHSPEEGVWAPGYYSVLFEDPEGIRLEVNFVPGQGNLDSASPNMPDPT